MRKTKSALVSLIIAGMAVTMAPFNVFAIGKIPTRLAGTTAEKTAVKIADQTGWTGTAILSSSTSYGMVDALTAGPLASYLKAPFLLTGPSSSMGLGTIVHSIVMSSNGTITVANNPSGGAIIHITFPSC